MNLILHMIRGMLLLGQIGSEEINNAHAECMALILMDEMLPLGMPCIVIMDSKSE